MLGQYKNGLEDARRAVALDLSFVKGYVRIAKCCLALGLFPFFVNFKFDISLPRFISYIEYVISIISSVVILWLHLTNRAYLAFAIKG